METTVKEKKLSKFQEKYFGLENKFNFNESNWKTDGNIFIASILIVPYFLMLLLALVFNLRTNENAQAVFQFLQIASVVVGFVVLSLRVKNYVKSGKGTVFFYTILPLALALIISIFLESIMSGSDFIKEIMNFIIMIFSTIIVITLAFTIDQRLCLNIKESFKKKFIPILIAAVVATLMMYAASIIIGLLESLWTQADASNQTALTQGLNNDSFTKNEKIAYAVVMFCYSVLIAPFVEEIVFRYAWFLNIGQKWLAFATSAIYFGFLHYGATADIEHALSYTAAGFILSGLFVFTKGNTLATWCAHFLNNLLAFILLVISVFGGQ